MVLPNITDITDFSPNPVNIAALGNDEAVFSMDKLYPALLQCFAIIICGYVELQTLSPILISVQGWINLFYEKLGRLIDLQNIP